MKNLILILFLLYNGFGASGQTQQFESSSSINEEATYKIEHISRLVVFTDKAITISNWLNGGTEAMELKIDRIEDKEFSMEGMCKWYYCTSLKKDIFNGFEKVIVIMPKAKDKIEVFTFANEVNVYHHEIMIGKD